MECIHLHMIRSMDASSDGEVVARGLELMGHVLKKQVCHHHHHHADGEGKKKKLEQWSALIEVASVPERR